MIFAYISSFCYQCLMCVLYLGVIYLIWKFVSHVYNIVTTESGIHIVDRKRQCIKMNDFLNPFCCEINYDTATVSGVECLLMCEGVCYVQPLWGVPIYSLVEFLNKYFLDFIKPPVPPDYKPDPPWKGECVYASEPLVLFDNIPKIVQFQLPSHVNQAMLSDGTKHLQTVYPFVLLMVRPPLYPDPYVVTFATAIHLPDKFTKKSQLVTQYIRLSSGKIGQIKKVYSSSSPDENTTDLCVICYQQPKTVVQLSCSHFCLCRSCYEKCDKCPLCRNTCMDFFEMPYLDVSHAESS